MRITMAQFHNVRACVDLHHSLVRINEELGAVYRHRSFFSGTPVSEVVTPLYWTMVGGNEAASSWRHGERGGR